MSVFAMKIVNWKHFISYRKYWLKAFSEAKLCSSRACWLERRRKWWWWLPPIDHKNLTTQPYAGAGKHRIFLFRSVFFWSSTCSGSRKESTWRCQTRQEEELLSTNYFLSLESTGLIKFSTTYLLSMESLVSDLLRFPFSLFFLIYLGASSWYTI